MKTNITHMLRFGHAYSVLLACGDRFRATRDDAACDQLCIGKLVRRTECKREVER